jgi:hypothetical protein
MADGAAWPDNPYYHATDLTPESTGPILLDGAGNTMVGGNRPEWRFCYALCPGSGVNVQGFGLKGVRHDLLRVSSPGRQYRMLVTAWKAK